MPEKFDSPEVKEQYDSQKAILERVGILEKLSSGELGVRGIDGKEYPLPGYEEIAKRFKASQELIKTKAKQGFRKLLIVPFGMKLDNLIYKYKQVILKHYKEGKLFDTQKDPQNSKEKPIPAELDENQPLWVWDGYPNADTGGELIYYPKKFSPENHQGKTKAEILKEEQRGFHILLVENLPNIPREGKGKEVGKRRQLEANKSSNGYSKQLQEKPYQGESGLTPEAWLAYAITYLEETNQVIDDWRSWGSSNGNLGAYFPASNFVPGAGWARHKRQARLGRDAPNDSDPISGARTAVRVW